MGYLPSPTLSCLWNGGRHRGVGRMKRGCAWKVHGNQPGPGGSGRQVLGARRVMGSHGGILTEGGMITFAFWKDPPKSSIERAGQEAGRPWRRPSWSTSRGGWPLPKGSGGGGILGCGLSPGPHLLAGSPLCSAATAANVGWQMFAQQAGSGILCARWPTCAHRAYAGPAPVTAAGGQRPGCLTREAGAAQWAPSTGFTPLPKIHPHPGAVSAPYPPAVSPTTPLPVRSSLPLTLVAFLPPSVLSRGSLRFCSLFPPLGPLCLIVLPAHCPPPPLHISSVPPSWACGRLRAECR